VHPKVTSHWLVRLSLERPIAMMMILLSMLVLGVVSWSRIPLQLVPAGFSPPFLVVETDLPDAGAADIEERITKPIEQAVATTPGLLELRASSSSGRSSVTLTFRGTVDMGVAYRDVRDRVARVRPELPNEVRAVRILKESGDAFGIAFYNVSWDRDLADPDTLIEEHIVRPIERLDGIALVEVWGRDEPEIRIDVDRHLAEAAHIDMVELVRSLGGSSFVLGSGEIASAEGVYRLRSVAEWRHVAEIAALPIGQNGLHLGDIAAVSYGHPPIVRYDRYDGRPSLVVSPIKESQANTVEVSDRISAVIAEATHHPDLQHVKIEPIFVQGDAIRYSLAQVVDSGVQGGVLALVVLVFFFRRLRMTAMISLSIPLSLFLALPVMDFAGQSINIVSLVGLMICIGLVVDNSIVVAENIDRYRLRGLGPHAAALQGASEVGLAITLATATTIVVFLPAALLSDGLTQFFMVQMVTPVCVSLLASLFVALVLVPLGSVTMLGDLGEIRTRGIIGRLDQGWKRAVEWLYDRTIDRLARAYERFLRTVLRRRMDVVVVSIAAMASITIPAAHVTCESAQNFGMRMVTVSYSMPSDTTLESADAFFKEIEVQVDGLKAKYPIRGAYVGFDADWGRVQIFFEPPEPGEPLFETMVEEIDDLMPTPPGWHKRSGFGDSDGTRDDSVPVVLYGESHESVRLLRAEIEPRLLALPGVIGLQDSGRDETEVRDELRLAIDRATSERFGVPANMVANTVAYAIRGAPLPRISNGEKQVDVWVRYQEADRENVQQLLGYRVRGARSESVPLDVLADRRVAEGEVRLIRTNKRVGEEIRLELDPDDRAATTSRVFAWLEAYRFPEGLSFDRESAQREVDDMQRDLTGALGLGAIFVFLLMGFLFESVVLPLAVLPSIPLALVGVWWFLYLTGDVIDALAGIGMVLLLGVVVNNAIVLIDCTNQARSAGLGRTDAIVMAGRLRLRPILMTALTTVGGMLPLAFSRPTGEGIPYGPFGKALVGGMTTATILTLVVVPVAYTYLDDLRDVLAVWWRRVNAHWVRLHGDASSGGTGTRVDRSREDEQE